MLKFVLSDSSVNSYGYRVLTSGLDLTEFKKGPIMLYDHRSYSLKPIGTWINIEIVGDKLMAEPHFDEVTETSKEVKAMVEAGTLNACSIGFDVIETSADPMHLLQGQTRETVTKAKIYECSIVAFPANSNAYKLRNADKMLTLEANAPSEFMELLVPSIKLASKVNQTSIKMDKEKILQALGLSANSSDEQVFSAIAQLSSSRVDALVLSAKTKGIVSDANADAFRQLANSNYDAAAMMVEKTEIKTTTAAPQGELNKGEATPVAAAAVTVDSLLTKAATLNTGAATAEKGRENWTFDDYQKKDPKGFLSLERENPDKAKQLVEEYCKN